MTEQIENMEPGKKSKAKPILMGCGVLIILSIALGHTRPVIGHAVEPGEKIYLVIKTTMGGYGEPVIEAMNSNEIAPGIDGCKLTDKKKIRLSIDKVVQ